MSKILSVYRIDLILSNIQVLALSLLPFLTYTFSVSPCFPFPSDVLPSHAVQRNTEKITQTERTVSLWGYAAGISWSFLWSFVCEISNVEGDETSYSRLSSVHVMLS